MFIKKILGAILLLAILTLPQNVFAEKTDWTDRNFYFRNIRAVIVFDSTVSPGQDVGGFISLRNMQDTFVQNSRKLPCRVYTEEEARHMIGGNLGMNLDIINASNPMQARQIIMQNAYKMADAWVIGNVDVWGNSTYIEPERTVWETRQERRRVYDRYGRAYDETYTIQVPVTYPPQRVDVSSVQMTLQVFDARSGQIVFARRDVRDRMDYEAQRGMFGRICNSFFEDLAKKIR